MGQTPLQVVEAVAAELLVTMDAPAVQGCALMDALVFV